MSFLSSSSREAIAALQTATDPLARLGAIRAAAVALEADRAALAAVRDALAADATWDEIAEAAGMKPAAAKWRWQGSDEEIAARAEAGRKRSARPSSVPTDLPGYSVADAAARLGLTVQAVYLRISRGQLAAETVELTDGRKYKRVMLAGAAAADTTGPHSQETDDDSDASNPTSDSDASNPTGDSYTSDSDTSESDTNNPDSSD